MQGCAAVSTNDRLQQPATLSTVVPLGASAATTAAYAGHPTREFDLPRHHDGGTEGSDDMPGEEFVVRVKAQVMKRDESTQMWLPTRGDPWSVVGLLRRRCRQRLGSGNGVVPCSDQGMDSAQPIPARRPSPVPIEYIIYARRVKDGQELINCRVEAGFLYCAASPTFHHWMAAAAERRHGLAFVNASDASRFEKHVRRAIADVSTSGGTVAAADSSTEEVFAAVHLPSAGPRRASPREISVVAAPTVSQLVRPVAIRSNGSGGTSLAAMLVQVPPAPLVHSELGCQQKPPSPAPLPHRPPLPPRANSSCSDGNAAVKFAATAPTVTRDDNDVWVHREDVARESRNGAKPTTAVAVAATETTSLDIKRRRQYSDYRKDYYVPSEKPLVISSYSDGSFMPAITVAPSDVMPKDIDAVVKIQHSKNLVTFETTDTLPLSTVASAEPKLPTKQKRRRMPLRKLSAQPLIVAATGRSNSQRRCRNCGALYHDDDNPRGACPEGDDPPMRFIERLTCSPCVNCVMYHCVDDEDGVESHDAWSCSCAGSDRRRSMLKWSLLALLGLVLPCVWCYPPLAACHRVARRSGVSGPRHASSR